MQNSTDTLLTPEEIAPVTDKLQLLLKELDRILLGRPVLHRLIVIGILSKGHILLEGVPGVGKTALIKTLGELLGLQFSRVQFTPDLMPSDILGSSILQNTHDGRREMEFQQGAIFTNILLADEINRASPKTQSALLEAMQERSVTQYGTTRLLPDPFFVLASQNPIELEGTYPLPEAQLDRFMFKLHVDMPDASVLQEIITSRRHGNPPSSIVNFDRETLHATFNALSKVFLPVAVANYIARIVAATHPQSEDAPSEVREYVQYGASPRAAIAIAESARATALLSGRPSVGFEDVKFVMESVLNHRILLGYKARMDRISTHGLLKILSSKISEVGLGLPNDVQWKE